MHTPTQAQPTPVREEGWDECPRRRVPEILIMEDEV